MIRFLFILCLAFGCGLSQNTNSTVLESLLDAYVLEFSIEKDGELFVSDMKGWTDSTSIVRIMSINAKDLGSGKIFFTEYNGKKIYFEHSELKNNKIDLNFSTNEFSIPNALKWEVIQLSNKQEEQDITPPEQFDEVQIIFNTSKNCIEESDMLGKLEFKERIKSLCRFCK